MKLLLYCTKRKPYLSKLIGCSYINGTIAAECDCDEIELIKLLNDDPLGTPFYKTDTLDEEDILKQSCLNADELYNYLGKNNGYAIHLSILKVFYEPKKLDEYCNKKPLNYDEWVYSIYTGGNGAKGNYTSYLNVFKLKKAPQNMMKCFDKEGNEYILLSIQPQHLLNILNGKKVIEVRKQILNCIKELIK